MAGAIVFVSTIALIIAVVIAIFVYTAASGPPHSEPAFHADTMPGPSQGGADIPAPQPTSNVPGAATFSATPAVRRTPTQVPSATPVAPQAASAVSTPPKATRTPAAPVAALANLSGQWRVMDTVEEGVGAGQTFTFDVSLNQSGNRVSGGNSGIQIEGIVTGQTALLTYAQPALGYSGTFTWFLGTDGTIAGRFTGSVPNSGRSELIPL